VLPSTAVYKSAIHAPHKVAFEVDLYAGPAGALLESNVPVFGGSITANLAHRVTRSGTFSVGPEFWPTSAADPLTPYQTVASIRAGIEYGDGSREMFPIITGRVGDLTRNANGDVTARIDDLAADVLDYRFISPHPSTIRITVLSQIERLISEVLPSAVFGPHQVTDPFAQTPELVWDEDRGKALDDLAETLGARWYALGDGTFVVRAYPYDVGAVLQTFADGPSGLLVSGTPSVTRDGAANSVTVVVERFDGGAPFRVTAQDASPGSPTRWGGPFGTITRIIKVQTPLTTGQATQYARAQLNASTALASQWSAAVVPDYTMEPGDTVRLTSRGVSEVQLIDSITYPLAPATMSLSTRAYVRAQGTLS